MNQIFINKYSIVQHPRDNHEKNYDNEWCGTLSRERDPYISGP